MTGMSLLRPCVRQGFRFAVVNGKPVITPLWRQAQLQGQVSVRNAGHERHMAVTASRFEWTRFKDDIHFYTLLGLLPMFAIIAYANIYIGPAELSDIPPDYEPKEWEYYQNPIKRWLVKYVYQEPQKEYEKTLHVLHLEREKQYWTRLEKKARHLMKDRQDYRGWYWVKVDKSIVDDQKAFQEERPRTFGTQ